MAKTYVDVNAHTFTDFAQEHNKLVNKVGDLVLLSSGDSDLVQSINRIDSDLPVDYVTITSNQTISGQKTFTGTLTSDRLTTNVISLVGDSVPSIAFDSSGEIYHTGTDMFMRSRTGGMLIQSAGLIRLQNYPGSVVGLAFSPDSDYVKLFKGNSEVLSTVTGGVSVTGNLSTSGNTIVSGVVQVDSVASRTTNSNLILAPNGTGNVSVSSKRIVNLADPVDSQDGATKNYIDILRYSLGWELVETFYDFAVDGVIPTATTSNLIDGYEYMIGFEGISHGDTTADRYFILDAYKETDAAWIGSNVGPVGGYGADRFFTGFVYLFDLREISQVKYWHSTIIPAVTDPLTNDTIQWGGTLTEPGDQGFISVVTPQKILKLSLTVSGGKNYDSGKLKLYRRKV